MALRYSCVSVELREISLRNKPKHMLQISPKGTVPVLMLPNGSVIDESLDIMMWALAQADPSNWLADSESSMQLIAENDGTFKTALDRYKYASRFPEKNPESLPNEGEIFLVKLEATLQFSPYLLASEVRLADIAIFPFIRQFAMVDEAWFSTAPYPAVRAWLAGLLASELFSSVMQKYPVWVETPCTCRAFLFKTSN
jgi:glutathione S-transferase